MGDGAVRAMPVIVLDRLARTLIGPAGERVEIPVLSLRLLEALALSSPAFVGAEMLQRRVWPDTHISADALKQRVRLLRMSLTAAGYDARLLDSARGEGYALRASIRDAPVDPGVGGEAVPPGKSSARRRTTVGVGVLALLLGLALIARTGHPGHSVAPIGALPVRVGIVAPSGSLIGSWLIDALAGNAHLLLVPVPVPAAPPAGGAADCGEADQIHLCLRVTPVAGDTARLTLTLSQLATGAILLRAEARTAGGAADLSSFVLRLAQFASPGVLRWIGGRTGAGDHTFTQYREGARLLGSCDGASRDDVIAGLREGAERSPNFLPGRAMLALHEMEAAVARADTGHATQVLREAESLVALSADLALAHLAIARGAAMLGSDSVARSAAARATRLQPVLVRFNDESGIPQTGAGSLVGEVCGRSLSATAQR